MKMVIKMEIEKIVQSQHAYFKTGETLSVPFRLRALKTLRAKIIEHEAEILEALRADLGKSHFEGYMTEVGLALDEIHYMEKHLKKLAKPHRVPTPLGNFRSKSFVIPSPYGTVLIMSPWNYPFQLTMEPLIDALAAGNTAVVKPGSYSPNTSNIIKKILEECFDEKYVAVVLGGRLENQALLDQKFEYIFFTGSKSVGREVQAKASVHLCPITLELGGKSPAIVDETANLKIAATRLAFGKYINVGQTCVAPDYLLIQKSVKDEFVKYLAAAIREQYGEKPLENPNFGKIINDKHFARLLGLIKDEKIIVGGQSDPKTLRIAPTVLDEITLDRPVMGEEIFGPILPILTYEKFDEIYEIIDHNPTPLALYLFTNNKKRQKEVLSRISFGGGCINDVIVHVATTHMAFGGVGESGMGGYHGKSGFDTFTHYKSIVDKKLHPDLNVRYQPYSKKKEKLLKMILK